MLKKMLSKPLCEQMFYSTQSFLVIIVSSKLFDNESFGLFNKLALFSIILSGVLVSVTFIPMIQVRKSLRKHELIRYETFNFIISMVFSLFSIIATFYYLLNFKYELALVVVCALYLGLKVFYEFVRRFVMISHEMTLLSSIALTNTLLVSFSYLFQSYYTISLFTFLSFLSVNYLLVIMLEVYKIYNKEKKMNKNVEFRNIFLVHAVESRWLFLSSILQIFTANYYLLALSSIHGAFQLGVFRAIQNITNLFNPLIAYFDNNIYIKVAQEKSGDGGMYILKSMLKFLLIISPFLLLINVFSKEILLILYNEDIARYHTLLPIFTISIIVIIVTTFFRIYLKNKSINSSSFWSYILITVVALSSSSFLIGQYGITGAAVGILGTQVLFLLLIALHYVLKHHSLRKP